MGARLLENSVLLQQKDRAYGLVGEMEKYRGKQLKRSCACECVNVPVGLGGGGFVVCMCPQLCFVAYSSISAPFLLLCCWQSPKWGKHKGGA